MPKAWSPKDERQYKKIKASERERGAKEDEAERIAAATVNKQRRAEGRTPNKMTQGAGNPRRSLEERSTRELYNRARELHIRGRSTMNKSELVSAIRSHT